MRYFMLNISNIKPRDEEHIKTNYPLRYARALKYSNRDDYLRSIGAYLLLEKAFGSFDEKKIALNKNGKPSLDGFPFFNYSHSGDFVVLVVGKIHEVGIDVQVFGDHSKKEIIEWTKKEAVLKLTGEGITKLHEETPTTYKNKKIKVILKRITSKYAVSIAYI